MAAYEDYGVSAATQLRSEEARGRVLAGRTIADHRWRSGQESKAATVSARSPIARSSI